MMTVMDFVLFGNDSFLDVSHNLRTTRSILQAKEDFRPWFKEKDKGNS